ncbi:MAG TPA: MFS transporter [Rickettsiales bacterium]|nr:MFS transporter [Rickettsiales bacterium]
MAESEDKKRQAFRFVFIIGIVSLFADFTYEGSRSIVGPYLSHLGASGAAVGIVAGLGELLGYGLRMLSGRISEKTRKFWTITIFGYVVQMFAVPLLALAGSWQVAALLVVAERVGKATRNPPRNVMLTHAGDVIGHGWVFGMHQAMDQFGAMMGPLCVAVVLAKQGNYKTAFAMLLIPALLTLITVALARCLFPTPENLHAPLEDLQTEGLPRRFWIYLAGAMLVAAGFPDFALMAFHFSKTAAVPESWIPIFYAIAMGTSGLGSLLFGKWFDKKGVAVLLPLTLAVVIFVPMVYLGGFWLALAGTALWGLGMGVHESIMPAAVTKMVPPARRASAYGIFSAFYGGAWFIGSMVIGLCYDHSIAAVMAFCIVAELLAIPCFMKLMRHS